MIAVPIASTFFASTDAGTERWAFTLQQREAAARQNEIDAQLAGLEKLQESQEATAEDTRVFLSGLTEATKLQTEALSTLQTAQDETVAELRRQTEALETLQTKRDELAKINAAFEARIKALETRLAGFLRGLDTSAGGLVKAGRRSDKGGFPTPTGEPHATGDIILSKNWGQRPGWIKCEGQRLLMSRYPNLGFVVAGRWGWEDPDHFRMPTRAEALADLDVYMRT